jgi:hypothetical protein
LFVTQLQAEESWQIATLGHEIAPHFVWFGQETGGSRGLEIVEHAPIQPGSAIKSAKIPKISYIYDIYQYVEDNIDRPERAVDGAA